MGTAVYGRCYESPLEAAAAVCAQYPVQSVTASGSLVAYRCTAVGGTDLALTRYERDPGGVLTTTSTTISAGGVGCDENQRTDDLMEMWYLGFVLLAAIWAAKKLYSIFNSFRGEA